MAKRGDFSVGLYFRDGIRLVYCLRVGPADLLLEDAWTKLVEEMPIKDAVGRLKLVRVPHSPKIAA